MTNPLCNNQYMLGKDFDQCAPLSNRVETITCKQVGLLVEVEYTKTNGEKSTETMTAQQYYDRFKFIK